MDARPEWLTPVRDACRQAVREELSAGLESIRRVVREELDREDEESDGEEDESDAGEDWKLLICVRHDLNMSVGKVAAQVGHAVHHAVTNSRWRDLKDWERSGSKKVTLKVDGVEQLEEIERDAKSKGLLAESIQDAGHTEVEPGTTTVLDRAQQLERNNKKLSERAERLQKELDEEKRKHRRIIAQLNAYRTVL